VAKVIHHLIGLSDHRFPDVTCKAFSEELQVKEILGRKGEAFTGHLEVNKGVPR
jgi:DNA-binding NtrC family response regulator